LPLGDRDVPMLMDIGKVGVILLKSGLKLSKINIKKLI